jgi:RHS repeat-associated protein
VTQITQTGQTGGNAVATVQVDLTYNAAGQPQTISRYVGGQLAVTATYTYDSDDNLTGLVYSQGGTTLAQYAWTYSDEAFVVPASAGSSVGLASADLGSSQLNWTPGSNLIVPSTNPSQIPLDLLSGSASPANLIASVTSVDGTANYSYDPTGQLTGATYSSSNPQSLIPNPESYSYDFNGNRTNTGYVTGPDNELLSDGTYNYAYDADGNRIERTNIATGAVTDYVWDNRDRLVEVIDRASAGGAITQDVYYTYDAENRWIGQTVSIPGQAVQETSFGYCGNQIVLQFDGTSSTTPLGVANLSHRYLWGPAVDQILAGEQVTSLTQPGDVLLPLTNNVGTACDLAQYNPGTGTTTVVDHRVYDSFGNLVSQTNAAVDFLFGLAGRPTDPATGNVNDLNRWYQSSTGDWLSKDPTGFDAGDTNVYRYVGNSPTNASDPTGMFWDWVCGGIKGTGQGVLNIVNGVQDLGIGVANAPAAAWNGIGWLEEKAGILNPDDPVRAPYIPSPDWSRETVTHEGGQGWADTHNWSKLAGATGVTAAVGAVRAAQAARAVAAAAAERAAANQFFNQPVPSIQQPGAFPTDYSPPWYPNNLFPGWKPVQMDPPLYRGPFPPFPGPSLN